MPDWYEDAATLLVEIAKQIVPLLSVGTCSQYNSPCEVLGFCK